MLEVKIAVALPLGSADAELSFQTANPVRHRRAVTDAKAHNCLRVIGSPRDQNC